jgi:hypothetical protein
MLPKIEKAINVSIVLGTALLPNMFRKILFTYSEVEMEFSENSRLKANVYFINNLKIENVNLKWKCGVIKNSYFGNFDSL